MRLLRLMSVLLVVWVGAIGVASATAIVLAGSDGSGRLAATRITDVGGGVVTVELLNFGLPANDPDDILTGLFLNIAGTFTPIPVSAFTSPTSTIVGSPTAGCTPNPPGAPCPSGANLNVGGEWDSLVTAAVVPYDYGISSSGYGVFGSSGNFNGPNLSDPNAPNGANFGLVSGIGLSPNAGVTNEPLTTGIVTFTLSGLLGFNPATQITGARFQYGTGLDHPFLVNTPGVPTPFDVPGGDSNPVPEPTSLVLMGTGLAFLVRRLRTA